MGQNNPTRDHGGESMVPNPGSLIRVIGLMSGTSIDGVDVALIETDGEEAIILGPSRSFAYSDEDRALLRQAANRLIRDSVAPLNGGYIKPLRGG